jgi:gamma-glutamylcyclotransferase (GGCT)/AIG2-like uncharacterized protein YtfP
MKRFAFYGSLRVDEYNYDRILKGQKGVNYVKTITIPEGFVLYSLGAYPMVFKLGNGGSPLVVDLFEIDNDRISNFIDMMEIGAGYEESKVVTEDRLEWTLYIGDYDGHKSHLKKTNIVTSGDWSQEIKKRRQKELNDTNQ